MNSLPAEIAKFIKKHHIFHLSVTDENGIWASTCFYAFDEKNASLVFTSEKHTRHSQAILTNPVACGSIALETKIVGKIQGVQFSGKILNENQSDFNRQKSLFYRRFPFAIAYSAPFWEFEMEYVKMTDNLLGFGKKLIWQRL